MPSGIGAPCPSAVAATFRLQLKYFDMTRAVCAYPSVFLLLASAGMVGAQAAPQSAPPPSTNAASSGNAASASADTANVDTMAGFQKGFLGVDRPRAERIHAAPVEPLYAVDAAQAGAGAILRG